jgi:hypothetical protein
VLLFVIFYNLLNQKLHVKFSYKMVDTSTYLYNSLLVKSLLKLTPIRERAYAWDWIAMLDGLTKSDTELCIRSDYVWYLLKCLECGNVSEPFNEVPPTRY